MHDWCFTSSWSLHMNWYIGRLLLVPSGDQRSTIGQPSVHYRSIVNWYISTLSANILAKATYRTHDPFLLPVTEHSTVARSQRQEMWVTKFGGYKLLNSDFPLVLLYKGTKHFLIESQLRNFDLSTGIRPKILLRLDSKIPRLISSFITFHLSNWAKI